MESPAPQVRHAPVRTAFSITLQLVRCHASLIALVREGHTGHPAAVQVAAARIATAILRGARDRSRDRHPRPRLYLQGTTEPLTRVRKRLRRAA